MRQLARRVLGRDGAFPGIALLKIGAASLAAGGVAYLVRASFSHTFPLISLAQVLAQGVVAGAAGIAVYFGMLAALREEAVYAFWHTFERRLLKVGMLPKSWDGEEMR